MAININQFVKFKQFELAPGANNEHPLTNDIYLVGYDNNSQGLKEIRMSLADIIPQSFPGTPIYALCNKNNAYSFTFNPVTGYKSPVTAMTTANIDAYKSSAFSQATTKANMSGTDHDIQAMSCWDVTELQQMSPMPSGDLHQGDFGFMHFLRWGEPAIIDSATSTDTVTHTYVWDVALFRYNESTFTWEYITHWTAPLEGGTGSQSQDGVGISNITGPVSSDNVDTYTIHLTNNDSYTFTVTNGTNGTNGANGTDGLGISSILKTGSAGNVDTYTITYTNGSTSTFNVTNGIDGVSPIDRFRIENRVLQVNHTLNDDTAWTTIGDVYVQEGGTTNNTQIQLNIKANQASCQTVGDAYIVRDNTSPSYGHLKIFGGLNIENQQIWDDGGNILGPGGRGITNITGPVTSGSNDTYTINYTDGTTSTFVVHNGTDGTNGTNGTNGVDGVDGVSPTVVTSVITGGTKVTITDALGAHSFNVLDGTQGPAGATGATGASGRDGRGILNITGPTTVGLNDTYTILYSDGTTTTFTVHNGANGASGNGIRSITGPVSAGLTDTYTINYTDNTTSTYTVTNGAQGAQGDPGTGFTLLRITLPTDDVDTNNTNHCWAYDAALGLYTINFTGSTPPQADVPVQVEFWDPDSKEYVTHDEYTQHPNLIKNFIDIDNCGVAEITYDDQSPYNYKSMMGCGMFGTYIRGNSSYGGIVLYSVHKPSDAAFKDENGDSWGGVRFIVKVYNSIFSL